MDETGRKRLWEEYGKAKTPEIREKLILEYAPLVKLVAGGSACILATMWSMMIWLVMVFSG